MKFLADMGISQRTVEWLQNKGYDLGHLKEQGLQRLADENILAKAINEGRIVLTMDIGGTSFELRDYFFPRCSRPFAGFSSSRTATYC